MKEVKVLEICARLDIGGAQAVADNISKYANKDLQFWYIVFNDDKIGEYEADIERRGGHVLHWPSPSKNFIVFIRSLIRLIKQEKIDVVHCHTMFNCGVVMLAAKLAGASGRISHSHTIKEGNERSFIGRWYRGLMRFLIHRCGTDFWACGEEAGKVLYGEKWFDQKGAIITNGIDTSAYCFREENRREIRELYGVEDKYVIGHVGHYVEVKNQAFLIDLMEKIRAVRPDAVMLLFGEGIDREKLQRKIVQCGAQEHIRLMGNVRNVGKVLSAFDVFVFPSLFEGTPLALIEAQANGLPCVISDSIPEDACLTEYIIRLPLSGKQEDWVKHIVEANRDFADHTSLLLSRYEDVRESMNCMYRVFYQYGKEDKN